MKKNPLVSIGIIFKNEIRCLERCLKSFQPLREAVPCELVMADTGSSDGSREIAGKYADILFDFPWIDDFAAARNAVMDRCSGDWYLSVDCDEWLDEDISDLLGFLRDRQKRRKCTGAAIVVRNYTSEDLESQYSDMLAIRLMRMDTGCRYEGAIHETCALPGVSYNAKGTVLHHDGYVGLDGEKGRPKRERNMMLLRRKLEENPKDLMCLIQCVESCGEGPERGEYLRRAVAGIEEKWDLWEKIGPPIYRYLIYYIKSQGQPGLDEEAARARELFPDSPFITLEVTYTQFIYHVEKADHQGAISYGEMYLCALDKYLKGGDATTATLFGALGMVSPVYGQMTRALLADAYFYVKEYEKSRDMLLTLKGEELNGLCVKNCASVIVNLHAQTDFDMSGYMADFWEGISKPVPSEARASERRRGVAEVAAQVFAKAHREVEDKQGFRRHGYTMFFPLAGKCVWGDAAAILEETDPARLTGLLRSVKEWKEFPTEALAHALKLGASFPSPDNPLKLEEMDAHTARIAQQDREELYAALRAVSEKDLTGNWQTLAFARSLALAAVQVFDWKAGAPDGVDMARTFAKVERAFLTGCYAPEVLQEANIFVLPSIDRFGWYCAQAFAALESGDAAGYARFLRVGLANNPAMKPMAEYLVKHTPELQKPAAPNAELLALAEKVRALLAAYPADDPAVEALKASPVYREVAHLIEGVDGGGLPS